MIQIERNKIVHIKLAITLSIALYLIIRSAINNFNNVEPWRNFLAVFLIILAILFLFLLIHSISESFKFKPALIINQKGIEDNISLSEAGFIEWENIESVFMGKMKGNNHIIIKLKDDYKPKVNSFLSKRILINELKSKFGNAIAINKDYVKEDLNYIMEQIIKIKTENRIEDKE